jgi:hypothetical protein
LNHFLSMFGIFTVTKSQIGIVDVRKPPNKRIVSLLWRVGV